MPVAVLQEGDEELPREPEYIPKLRRAVLRPRLHAGSQLADQFLEGWPREPAIGLHGHDLPLSLHEAQQRHDVLPVALLELGGAGRLAPGALKGRKQVAPKASLSIAEARPPSTPGNEAPFELQFPGAQRLAHDQIDQLMWCAHPRAHRLEGSTRIERGDTVVL